jgi:ferredoxin
MSERLAVDLSLCRGHGICMLLAGDRIELDQWGFPIVDSVELDSKAALRRARRAAAGCPTGALRIHNESRPDPT